MSADLGTDLSTEPSADFARQWAAAIIGTSYVAMTDVEVYHFLAELTARMAAAVEDGDTRAGYEVGVALVRADFTAPEALGRTVTTFEQHFPTRHPTVLGALATGFTRTLRDRTLDEQDSIRQAALTARAQAEAALLASEKQRRYAALHDPLTGLPNRTLFTSRLAETLKRAERIAVCVVNLDRFDVVNDSLGPEIGDQVLIEVAARLGELRRGLSRLGGDEFGFLLDDTTGPGDAVALAEKILAVLNEPFRPNITLTGSIGLVERATRDTDPTDLIRAARMSLHWAKVDGKARWALYDAERSAGDVARYRLSADMPGALDRDEFRLVYQPLVGLADRRMRGTEALARWDHPVHGLVEPLRFIGLAEDTGLIVPLGRKLLEQACHQAAGWRERRDDPPYVSVNLAVRQLRDPGLLDDVRDILDDTRLPAERLQLEITESAIVSTDDGTLGILHRLADLGVRLAIDDFGTGYANLAYLRHLPVHALKLDASFVRALAPTEEDPTGEAILRAIVSLGHTLGLTVTAEGVETAGQARQLAALGCDTGQGWHLGRPVDPSQLFSGASAA